MAQKNEDGAAEVAAPQPKGVLRMNKYSLNVIWNGETVDTINFVSENDDTAIEVAKGWIEFDEGEYGVLYDRKTKAKVRVIKK